MENRYDTLNADDQRKARVLFPLFARCVEANTSDEGVNWYDAVEALKRSAREAVSPAVIDGLVDMACDHETLFTGCHPLNAECYRNVFKSVHGINPRTYPASDDQYRKWMRELEREQGRLADLEESQRVAEREAWEKAFAPAPAATIGDILKEALGR